MVTKLLDTTILIHHWAGRESVAEYLESQAEGTEYATTTINLKEIAVGRKLTGEFDPVEIRAQFEWVRVVPITVEIAWEVAEIESQLYRDEDVDQDRNESVAANAIIAGVASELGATVVTENVEDFERLGVDVEGYN